MNSINISRNEFYDIYNKYSFNELTEINKSLIKNSNTLFINFIDKKLIISMKVKYSKN